MSGHLQIFPPKTKESILGLVFERFIAPWYFFNIQDLDKVEALQDSVASCKVVRVLLVESILLEIQLKDWNPECTDKEYRFQVSGIQNPRLSWISLH